MAFAQNNPVLASDFVNLKARVKAECKRRKYNGSVAKYAGSSYDYTVTPTAGSVPLPEHLNKIIVPLNAIVNTGITQTKSGYLVRTIASAQQQLSTLESISATAANSGCASSCTGLCQGTCASGCTSCTGSCTNACTSCTGGCTSCSGGCGDICHTDCATGCYSKCDDSCSPTCSYNCALSCKGSCEGGCLVRCRGICKGITTEQPIN